MKNLEEFIAYYTQYAEFCNKVGDTEESETVKNLLGLFEELQELRKQEHDRCSDCAGCVQWKCDCSNVRQQAVNDFVQWVDKYYDTKMYINDADGYKDIFDFYREFLEDQEDGE